MPRRKTEGPPKKTGPKPRPAPTQKELDQAGYIASLGLRVENIAGCMNMSRSSFFRWMDKYPEVREAIEKGRDQGIQRIARALGEKALEGDTTAMIFYLKTQARWRTTDEESQAPQIVFKTEIAADGSFNRQQIESDAIDVEAVDTDQDNGAKGEG